MGSIAESYGCSNDPIRAALKSNGVRLRPNAEFRANKMLDQETQNNICHFYENGNSLCKAEEEFGISRGEIKKILRKRGIRIKGALEVRTGITSADFPDICKQYLEGKTTIELGKIFNCKNQTIKSILKREGVKIRDFDVAHWTIPINSHEEICRRYRSGESSRMIASDYGLFPNAIIKVLKKYGVEIRGSADGIPDLFIHLLLGEGRFKYKRETDFYVYTINGHPHLKPGIAFFSPDARQRQSRRV